MSPSPQDLPDPLPERVRVLSDGAMEGAFVLYWVRGALRAHENPALDVAVAAANRLGLPLFVHQALSERYPWASDRHHTFILEGARDLARDLAGRGIGYAMHVARPGHRDPVTRTLGQRAALVVLEDLPTHPLVDWTEALVRSVDTPVWSVDTACVVPMTRVDRVHTRAYAFRDAINHELASRVRLPWSDVQPEHDAFVPPDLPYEPVDLEGDLAALVAACAIDHTVAPVADTRGGSRAGYARWQAFVRSGGLKRYARTRNNAAKDGVSRMSAYLHHGMVAPTRLAREAAEHGGKGADKYLDELVIWRELAWAFCRGRADHHTLAALPGWARATLGQHADDPREALFDRETLGRARTGQELWDACQRSLLQHGELHNNVRMTWGKALLHWTAGPTEALDALIDLNHRYALDGRDPASFGGLLWCMGGFDRPFKPERPVTGTVRGRSIDRHASRLDLEAYRHRVSRPLHRPVPRVAVLGAGPAGALCARTLADHGLDVVAFDKGRGAGGRLSTRRVGAWRFDHGSACVGALPSTLERYVAAWRERGLLEHWQAPFTDLGENSAMPMPQARRLVASPGMSQLVKHLLADVHVRYSQRAIEVSLDRDAPEGPVGVRFEDGSEHRFDHVLVATPAPQAVPLLTSAAPELAERLDAVVYAPCWTLLLAFPVDTGRRWGLAEPNDDPALGCIIRNQTKPGRPPGEQWVVQASAAWSREHLEQDREQVAQALLSHLRQRLDLPEPVHVAAHRWRYARVERPVGEPCLLTASGRLGVCGDGVAGDGVGLALSSGATLAGRLLSHLHHHASPAPTAAAQLSLLSPEAP